MPQVQTDPLLMRHRSENRIRPGRRFLLQPRPCRTELCQALIQPAFPTRRGPSGHLGNMHPRRQPLVQVLVLHGLDKQLHKPRQRSAGSHQRQTSPTTPGDSAPAPVSSSPHASNRPAHAQPPPASRHPLPSRPAKLNLSVRRPETLPVSTRVNVLALCHAGSLTNQRDRGVRGDERRKAERL